MQNLLAALKIKTRRRIMPDIMIACVKNDVYDSESTKIYFKKKGNAYVITQDSYMSRLAEDFFFDGTTTMWDL